VTYTPAANYNGPDSFTFKASDGAADSNPATVSITVNPVNDAPVATDQAVATDEDTPLPVTLAGTDVDHDPLTYAVVTPPAHGTFDGTTYRPADNYNGPDSFTFKASDGTADSNPATVSITVNPVNDAPVATDQTIATDEDTPLAIRLTATEPDGDPLTFAVVAPPAHGTLSGSGADLTYTPGADYNGSDAFTFKVNDSHSDSNVATVAITVRPVNDAPACAAAVVDPATLWSPHHAMVPLAITGVTDVEGDPITIAAVSVWQDEPDDAEGDGSTSPDATLSPLQVRAERSGQHDGRVYHIGFRATDGHGGACTGQVLVCVPHDQSGPGSQCVDGGALYDSTRP
jgi:hypothetical protein